MHHRIHVAVPFIVMSPPVLRDDERLASVGASLLLTAGELGLFHYNKLQFLFEYLYIRNFGKRFTKEVFVRLPHGPAIVDYKKHLETLESAGIAEIDVELLRASRSLKDDSTIKVPIKPGAAAGSTALAAPALQYFVAGIVSRYAALSVPELEEAVYRSQPMKAYKNSTFKKEVGGYILTSDIIRIKDHDDPVTAGRRMALDHLRQFPEVIFEQQRDLAAEFAPLQSLRPA